MLEIVIARPLVTRFHRQLVTPEWVAKLREFLSTTRLRGQGRLQTEFGDERYMGPESVVKYRFHVVVNDEMADLSPIQTGESAFVEWQPKRGGFKMLGVWWWLEWRDDVLRRLLPKECKQVGDWQPLIRRLVYTGAVTNEQIGDLVRTYSGVPALEGEVDPEVMRHARASEKPVNVETALHLDRMRGFAAVRVEEPAVIVAVSDWTKADNAAGVGMDFDRRVGLRWATQEQVDAILAQREG